MDFERLLSISSLCSKLPELTTGKIQCPGCDTSRAHRDCTPGLHSVFRPKLKNALIIGWVRFVQLQLLSVIIVLGSRSILTLEIFFGTLYTRQLQLLSGCS